jgi:hypothetical protein
MEEWATPTPLGSPGLTPTAYLDLGDYVYEVPGGIVQGYNLVNSHGLFDVFWWALIILVVVMGLVLITQRMKQI